MPEISASYASPGLRWGLLVDDHPGAHHTFELVAGADLGIPPDFGGAGQFCVATIIFPADSGREPVRGWKPAPARGSADDWNVLCTKTLGRALKKAGYPDHLPDLRALVHWRQRNAEVAVIAAGMTPLAIEAGQDDEALDENQRPIRVANDDDDAEVPVGHDDEAEDAELVDPDDPDLDHELLARVRAMPELQQTKVAEWARQRGLSFRKPVEAALANFVEVVESSVKRDRKAS